MGAPIVKNKLFAFGGYQGRIENSNPPTTISYAPTAEMLAGDFTAFASPACNSSIQRTLAGGFVNNRIDPSKLNSVALNFLKHVPVSHQSVRQAAVRDPEQRPRASGAGQGRLHDQLEFVAVRPLFLRGLRQPGDLRRHQRPDAQPHQPEQPGALAGPGAQSGAAASTLNSLHVTFNKTLNDRPLPPFFSATDLGSKVSSLVPQYMGATVTGNGFSVSAAAHRVIQLHQLPDRRRRRPRPRRP